MTVSTHQDLEFGMRLERRQACITDITSSLSSLVTCNSRIGSDHSGEGLLGVIPAKACWGSPGEGLFGGHPGEGRGQAP